jgi:uncharacterized caspase-like protein
MFVNNPGLDLRWLKMKEISYLRRKCVWCIAFLIVLFPKMGLTGSILGPPSNPHALDLSLTAKEIEAMSPDNLKELREAVQNAHVVVPTAFPQNLHILAIGIDHYQSNDFPSFRFARKDVEDTASAFKDSAKVLFDDYLKSSETITLEGIYQSQLYHFHLPASFVQTLHKSYPAPEVHLYTLLDEEATRHNIEVAFQKIIATAKPDDFFVFAFSGVAFSGTGESYIMPVDFSGKSLTTAISGAMLHAWCEQIQAKKQISIFNSRRSGIQFRIKATNDPQNLRLTDWPERVVSMSQATNDPQNLKQLADRRSLVIIGDPGTTSYDEEHEHSILTYALLQGLAGEANLNSSGVITAFELGNYLFKKVAQVNAKLHTRQQVEIFQQGEDFWVSGVPDKVHESSLPDDNNPEPPPDKTPPSIAIVSPELQRGVNVVIAPEPAFEVSGQAMDASGVREVSVNDKAVALNKDGTFDAILNIPMGETEVLIRAVDTLGNSASTTFTVKRDASPAPPQAVPDYQGTDYALLFAGDDYQHWPHLNNPIHDVETMAQVLQDHYGFTTDIVRNPQLRDFQAKLREYAAKKWNPDDQLLIFFAGHGAYDKDLGEGYLVANNSPAMEDKDLFYDNSLPLSLLAGAINNIRCPHILVLVDACYGGTFGDKLVRNEVEHDLSKQKQAAWPHAVRLASTATPERLVQMLASPSDQPRLTRAQYIRRMLRPVSRLFLTSGQIREVADGPPGGHSPFAAQLLSTLQQGGDEYRVIDYDGLKRNVLKLPQEPYFGSWGNNEDGGEFLFVAK